MKHRAHVAPRRGRQMAAACKRETRRQRAIWLAFERLAMVEWARHLPGYLALARLAAERDR